MFGTTLCGPLAAPAPAWANRSLGVGVGVSAASPGCAPLPETAGAPAAAAVDGPVGQGTHGCATTSKSVQTSRLGVADNAPNGQQNRQQSRHTPNLRLHGAPPNKEQFDALGIVGSNGRHSLNPIPVRWNRGKTSPRDSRFL